MTARCPEVLERTSTLRTPTFTFRFLHLHDSEGWIFEPCVVAASASLRSVAVGRLPPLHLHPSESYTLHPSDPFTFTLSAPPPSPFTSPSAWFAPIAKSVAFTWSAEKLFGSLDRDGAPHPVVLALYQDAVEEDDARRSAFRPELYTTTGEPLVFCEDTWKLAVNTVDEIAERVLELGATEDDASGAQARRFSWMDGKSNVVIGGVTLRANRLVLESNSKERQKKLKSKLVRALGRRIEHVSEKERTPEELMKGPRVVPEPSRVPPEIEKEALAAALRSHYGSWPDTKLPALGRRTPRQCAKTKKGRTEVEAIIRDMEYKTHGTRMSGAYDFYELRAELGLRLKT